MRRRTDMDAVRQAVPLAMAIRATNSAIDRNIRAQEAAQHAGLSGAAYDMADEFLYGARSELSERMTDVLGLAHDDKDRVEDWAIGEMG